MKASTRRKWFEWFIQNLNLSNVDVFVSQGDIKPV